MTLARPSIEFVWAHPAHSIALGFGAGLGPWAPGTFGTALAVPLWWLLGALGLEPVALLALVGLLFAAGVWACGLTARHLGVPDHGAIVWDETVAFLLLLVLVPPALAWQAAAFVLFRGFDIAKPPPIRHFERRLGGGFGVMFDDLLAAGYTLLALALAKRVLDGLGAA